MKAFNLAEEKIAERSFCKQHVTRRLRVAALFIVLTLLVSAISCVCRISVRNKANRLKLELAEIQGRCAEEKREISAVEAKAKQRKWQKQLAHGSEMWLDVLDAVLHRVPPDVWLDKVETSSLGSEVAVDGQAASFGALSTFMGGLRSESKFSDVRLSSTRTGSEQHAGMVEFSLQVKLKTSLAPSNPATASASPAGVPNIQESL